MKVRIPFQVEKESLEKKAMDNSPSAAENRCYTGKMRRTLQT